MWKQTSRLDRRWYPRQGVGLPRHRAVAYFVNELTVNLTPENEDLIEQLDWYILIVHNPDGYDYSWTTDRGGRNATRLLVGLIGLGNSLTF